MVIFFLLHVFFWNFLGGLTKTVIFINFSLLYNGSRFKGHQKSKGNSYEVEVILQVSHILMEYSVFSWLLESFGCVSYAGWIKNAFWWSAKIGTGHRSLTIHIGSRNWTTNFCWNLFKLKNDWWLSLKLKEIEVKAAVHIKLLIPNSESKILPWTTVVANKNLVFSQAVKTLIRNVIMKHKPLTNHTLRLRASHSRLSV